MSRDADDPITLEDAILRLRKVELALSEATAPPDLKAAIEKLRKTEGLLKAELGKRDRNEEARRREALALARRRDCWALAVAGAFFLAAVAWMASAIALSSGRLLGPEPGRPSEAVSVALLATATIGTLTVLYFIAVLLPKPKSDKLGGDW